MEQTDENVQTGEMSQKEMEDLLLELEGTPYWPALLRFNRKGYDLIVSTLLALDPFKNPTEVARVQGMTTGIFRAENELARLKEERRRQEEERQRKGEGNKQQ